jgi:predicted DNA-binding ribbon-helix-helix protein
MNKTTLDSSINVRLATPVFKQLRKLAADEDLKIADLIRKAIKKTYGTPKQNS